MAARAARRSLASPLDGRCGAVAPGCSGLPGARHVVARPAGRCVWSSHRPARSSARCRAERYGRKIGGSHACGGASSRHAAARCLGLPPRHGYLFRHGDLRSGHHPGGKWLWLSQSGRPGAWIEDGGPAHTSRNASVAEQSKPAPHLAAFASGLPRVPRQSVPDFVSSFVKGRWLMYSSHSVPVCGAYRRCFFHFGPIPELQLRGDHHGFHGRSDGPVRRRRPGCRPDHFPAE